MVGTTKTLFTLSALAVSAQFNPVFAAAPAAAAAAAVPGDRDGQIGAAEAVDKQNNAFKVSPQDMNFDQHKIDDDEKFSAPRKAPNDKQAAPPGDAEPEHNIAPPSPEGDSLASSGSKGSKILDDYDPNRLGVSADEAKSGKDAQNGKNAKSGKSDASKDAKSDGKAKGDAVQNKQSNGDRYAGSRKKSSKGAYLEPKKSIPWEHGDAVRAAAGPATAGPVAGPASVAGRSAAGSFAAAGPSAAGPVAAGVSAAGSVAAGPAAAVPSAAGPAVAAAAAAAFTAEPIAAAAIKPSQAAISNAAVSLPLLSSAAAAPASHIIASATTSLPVLSLSATGTSTYTSVAPVDKDRQQEAKNLQDDAGHSDKAKSNAAKEKAAKEKEAVEEHVMASEHSFGKLLGAALMIVTSEIGDKTFFIAALMAMRHPHLFVFSSSYSAMVFMTILSMVLGLILPSLLSKRVTTLLAALLFLVFGYRLLKEGWSLDPSLAATDELEDVEQDIEMQESTMANEKAEGGGTPRTLSSGSSIKQYVAGLSNLAALVLSPLWIQIFAMTFLGEWGDRSQIATVAMGAGSGWKEVLIGCLVGHFITTAIAVVGGKILAQHLSLRTITLSGAACFFLFAIIYFNDWLNQ